jgi:hypothetical protein
MPVTAPFTITIRVFQSDKGWSFRVALWRGNVDPMHDPPTHALESRGTYKTTSIAWAVANRHANRMVLW